MQQYYYFELHPRVPQLRTMGRLRRCFLSEFCIVFLEKVQLQEKLLGVRIPVGEESSLPLVHRNIWYLKNKYYLCWYANRGKLEIESFVIP